MHIQKKSPPQRITPEARAFLELGATLLLAAEQYEIVLDGICLAIEMMTAVFGDRSSSSGLLTPYDNTEWSLFFETDLHHAGHSLSSNLIQILFLVLTYRQHVVESMVVVETAPCLQFLAHNTIPRQEIITRICSAPFKTFDVPERRTFHCFSRLPVELQILVWEAAILPPPCAHYAHALRSVVPKPLGRPGYRGDRGLWGACRLSRYCIQREYARPRQHCFCFNSDLELMYQQWVFCREHFAGCQEQFDEFDVQLKKVLNRYRRAVPPQLRDVATIFYDTATPLDDKLTPAAIKALIPGPATRMARLWLCPGL